MRITTASNDILIGYSEFLYLSYIIIIGLRLNFYVFPGTDLSVRVTVAKNDRLVVPVDFFAVSKR